MKCQARHAYTCVSAVQDVKSLKRGEQGGQVPIWFCINLLPRASTPPHWR